MITRICWSQKTNQPLEVGMGLSETRQYAVHEISIHVLRMKNCDIFRDSDARKCNL
jgi:hypothetical protein